MNIIDILILLLLCIHISGIYCSLKQSDVLNRNLSTFNDKEGFNDM